MLSPEVSRFAARVVNDNYVPDDVRAQINAASSDEEMLAALSPLALPLNDSYSEGNGDD